MRRFLKWLVLLILMVAVSAAVFLNFFLARIARSEDFKRFAEEKVGEYLKAKVHIGEIKPYRLSQLSLENILIESPSSKGGEQFIRVERLLFRYQFLQLWNRKFDVPSGVVMKNPSILIDQDQFPYRYFESTPRNTSAFALPSLDFKGGEIRYLLPALGKEIVLKDVEGKIQPSAEKKVQVDIRASMSGIMVGRVHIYGSVDPLLRTHDLWMELNDTDLASDIPVPLRGLEGRVHWVDQDLSFTGLRAALYGWNVELSGSLVNDSGQPKVELRLNAGKGTPSFKWNMLLDLSGQHLEGAFEPLGSDTIHFNGKVHQERRRLIVDSLEVDPGYLGRGELDFSSGNYELIFEKGKKRMAVHSNLQGLDFTLNFHFDHIQALGMDLVTQGKIFLRSGASRWKGHDLLFKGEFETDYFILDRQPFRDLKGRFDLSSSGITAIQAFWGNQFEMSGQVTAPNRKPHLKLLLQVDDFDLGNVQTFAARPLPKALGGRLGGRLTIEGPLFKPEVVGIFNIHDGKWGQLNYDRGIIQLRGFLPYLPLKDSKIWKGRTVFYLNGALDLNLDNMFAGVKIQTPDNLVIWKGIEAALHEKGSVLELNPSKWGEWGEFSPLEAGTSEGAADRGDPSAKDDAEEESKVLFGPKLKF